MQVVERMQVEETGEVNEEVQWETHTVCKCNYAHNKKKFNIGTYVLRVHYNVFNTVLSLESLLP